eukprot:98168_1
MSQLSGRKRYLHRRAKPSKRPNKKAKKEHYERIANKSWKEDKAQRLKAKHPFTSFDNKPKIKLDKSSNNTNTKYEYVKPNHPLSKKDLRERKRDRKSKKSHGVLRSELNYLASSTQNNHQKISKMSRKNQHEFVAKMLTKMAGNVLNIIKNLDSTRAIQTAIKYGSQPQILAITKELKGHFIDLCCDHYAHKTVRALLEYGRKEVRDIVVSELMKAITRLILHRLASPVVDYAIMIIANEDVKRKAFQYFISPQFIVMTQYEGEEDKTPKTVRDIISSASMMERNQILKNMEKFLLSGFEKEIVSTGIFQTILYHYVCNIWHDKKKLEEMIELVIPSVMQIQNVQEGVMALLMILNYSARLKPKLRKTLIRNMSDFVITMCCDKHSYLIIIKLLDVIDDTTILNKVIVKPIIKHLSILMYHDFGRLVLLHLLCPRNTTYFQRNKLYNLLCTAPITQRKYEELKFMESDEDEDGDIDVLNANDGFVHVDPLKQANCKKDFAVKRVQLLKTLVPALMRYCGENVKKVLCHTLSGGVVIELVRVALYEETVKALKGVSCDALITEIVNASIVDLSPRQISPEPRMPQPPSALHMEQEDGVEIHNIVDDSLNLVDKKQLQSNLATVDLSKMDPGTARNIEKLQQQQRMKKNDELYMKLNAKYEVEMIEYQLTMIRHKSGIKTEDMSKGIMEHGLAHRRVRKMVEQFDNEFHQYFVAVLLDEHRVDEDRWIHFLSVKGAWVIWELFNRSSQENKGKLSAVLKPVCVKMSNIINKSEEYKYKGLRRLCEALEVDL